VRISPVYLVRVNVGVFEQRVVLAFEGLLTTLPTGGHAMKADDPAKAFGYVSGKALRPPEEGRGLIPILIALQ
jgi:hypothetical protein